jgi:hypothetical protein
MLISILIGLVLPSRSYILIAAPVQAGIGVALGAGTAPHVIQQNFPVDWVSSFIAATAIAALLQFAAFEAKRWWMSRTKSGE